jgi:hypothetical protein
MDCDFQRYLRMRGIPLQLFHAFGVNKKMLAKQQGLLQRRALKSDTYFEPTQIGEP